MDTTTEAANNPTPDNDNQQNARAKFDAARLTRRQALAKFGFQFGATALTALTVDDLVRAVGREMSQRTTNNKVASAVATQMSNAGVAYAAARPDCALCRVINDDLELIDCGHIYCLARAACCDNFGRNSTEWMRCLDQAKTDYRVCIQEGESFNCQSNPVNCDCGQGHC